MKKIRKFLCVFLSVIIASGVFTIAAAAYDEGEIYVTVMVYEGAKLDGNGDPIPGSGEVIKYDTAYGITAGLAADLGFDVAEADPSGKPITEPTVFDALVAFYGRFDSDYLDDPAAFRESIDYENGSLKRYFDIDFSEGGFLVNGCRPNDGADITAGDGASPTVYAADEARIKDGDRITLFTPADRAAFSDAYARFDEENVFVHNADTVTVTLRGYEYAMSNGNKSADEIAAQMKPLEGVTVYLQLHENYGVVKYEPIGKTDKNGQLTFSTENMPSYMDIFAYGTDANGVPVIAAHSHIIVSVGFFYVLMKNVKSLFQRISDFFARLFGKTA